MPIGVLYPNQTTRLIESRGKWIRIEYFDHIENIHKSGWCLEVFEQGNRMRDVARQ